jgi:hypothetical protein
MYILKFVGILLFFMLVTFKYLIMTLSMNVQKSNIIRLFWQIYDKNRAVSKRTLFGICTGIKYLPSKDIKIIRR